LPDGLEDLLFCQGRVDPLTRQGAVVIKSSGKINRNGTLKSLELGYWYRLPTNDAPQNALGLFRIEADGNGKLKSLTVAGKPVKIDNENAVNAALQAIRDAHAMLKANKLPNMAQIFSDNDLHRVMGETIRIAGQKTQKQGEAESRGDLPQENGFDFKFTDFFNRTAAGEDEALALPNDPAMLKALFGNYSNSAAPLFTLRDGKRKIAATFGPGKKAYSNDFSLKTGGSGSFHLHASIKPDSADQEAEPVYYPDLVEVFAKAAAEGEYRIEKLKLANVDFTGADNKKKMEVIGAINGMTHEVSRQNAPVPIAHLAKFNLLNLATSSAQLHSNGEKPFRFMMVSEYGNGLTKVYGDFGGGLGACKRLIAGDVVGLHDLPMEPAKDGSEVSCATPNISDGIRDIDFICLTHRHIDHIGGFPYEIENLKGKTVICTPQVFEHLKRQVRTLHGSKTTQMMRDINWIKADKTGHATFSKDGGKSGMTVVFSPNASPHSAYCTPYYYAAFETDASGKKQIRGVYANLGDLRDENDENINLHFFQRGWRYHLKKAHPDLGWDGIPTRPTYCDWDSTSVRSEGQTPRKDEILQNMKKAVKWCKGKTVLNVHLASSDNMFEIMLHTAAYDRRDFITFGKNMEDTQSIQNIFGYDELDSPWPKGHQNQIYMDGVHAGELQKEVDTFCDVDLEADKEKIENELNETFGYCMNMWELEFQEHLDILRAQGADEEAKRLKFYRGIAKEIIREKEKEPLRDKTKDLDPPWDTEIVSRMPGYHYLRRRWYEENGESRKAEYCYALMTQALHNNLRDLTNNFWRYMNRNEWATEFALKDKFDLGGICITRNTETSAMMFRDHPERLYLAITGSQGNDVEVESQLYKILENRALLNGEDPEFRHTARPINKENCVLFNTQSVIPGNETQADKLAQRAVREHGLIYVKATHTGFEMFNTHRFGKERFQQIESDLIGMKVYNGPPKGPQQKLVIPSGMPIGYKGHGRGGDVIPWMQRVRAEINASQHVNDPEAARLIKLKALSIRQGAIDLVQDGEIVELDRFDERKAILCGRVPRGINIIRNDYPYQKPFKVIVHKESFKLIEPDGAATHLHPLMAGCPAQLTISTIFGVNADTELEQRIEKEGKAEPSRRRAPADLKHGSGGEWADRTPMKGPAVPGAAGWDKTTCELA